MNGNAHGTLIFFPLPSLDGLIRRQRTSLTGCRRSRFDHDAYGGERFAAGAGDHIVCDDGLHIKAVRAAFCCRDGHRVRDDELSKRLNGRTVRRANSLNGSARDLQPGP